MSKEKISRKERRRLEREQGQIENEARQRINREKFLEGHLSSKFDAGVDSDSYTTLTNQELSRVSNLSYEELTAKFLAVEKELWSFKLKNLEDATIRSSVPSVLRKAYQLGYKDGYLRANQSDEPSAKEHRLFKNLSARSQDAYYQGFADGRHFWYWMWNGM